jgi:hypothetical protein
MPIDRAKRYFETIYSDEWIKQQNIDLTPWTPRFRDFEERSAFNCETFKIARRGLR